MDNNNPKPDSISAQPSVVPPVQFAPPEKEGNEQNSSSNKMIMFLVIGVIIVVLIVGGIYFLLIKQQTPAPATTGQTTSTPAPTLANIKNALDQELESINVAASEGDFKSVDQDLQSL